MANVPAWSVRGFGIRPAGDKIYSAGGCQNIYWEFVKRYIGRLSEQDKVNSADSAFILLII